MPATYALSCLPPAAPPRPAPPAPARWNFTPSPGWTKEEVQVLKLCLMKHGVGRWVQILSDGLLPGKLIQQLNGQTQRLLGQQSLAAYTGLCVDVDRIRADNEARTDAERKQGLIINTGREWAERRVGAGGGLATRLLCAVGWSARARSLGAAARRPARQPRLAGWRPHPALSAAALQPT